MDRVRVSIITVVFNNSSTIKNAIDSVLEQTYKNIEYIVIDGGSTDGTVDIVKEYQDKISMFISEPDDGIYDAYNKGINISTGDVIAILNSDDIFHNKYVISEVVEQFQLSGADIVYGDLYYVKENNLNDVTRYWKSSIFEKNSFAKGWHPPHPSFFAKKVVYEKFGDFDTNIRISADFEIMLRFLEKFNVPSSYLSKVIVRMRSGGESNKSISNIIDGNKGILKAFNKNNISVNKFFYVFYRFAPKVMQILKRGK